MILYKHIKSLLYIDTRNFIKIYGFLLPSVAVWFALVAVVFTFSVNVNPSCPVESTACVVFWVIEVALAVTALGNVFSCAICAAADLVFSINFLLSSIDESKIRIVVSEFACCSLSCKAPWFVSA